MRSEIRSRLSQKAPGYLDKVTPVARLMAQSKYTDFMSPAPMLIEALRWSLLKGPIKHRLQFPFFRKERPANRSVVFLHHCYYNFYYLAKALRKRGWDAVSVCIDGPDHGSHAYAHGADMTLYDDDPEQWHKKINDFVRNMPDRFSMLHFYGLGRMSWFPFWWDQDSEHSKIPIDFLYLKRNGLKIGYTTCGCLDGVSQDSFYEWSGGCCDKCVWQTRPDVCSNDKNIAWGRKVGRLVDLYATEGLARLDFQGKVNCYSEPLTQALDPDFWSPDLTVPDEWKIAREPGEIIVFHAVGNFTTRSRNGRNIKGTGAVEAAVERLKAEGVRIRLVFATDIHSRDVRFLQVQSDIVVDQLNFGRYGSISREALMLGKPTICRINPMEPGGEDQLLSLEDCPLVSADEATIYDVLKDLAQNDAKRKHIGRASRDYAMKWFAMDACAERFEQVYDRLMNNETPQRETGLR